MPNTIDLLSDIARKQATKEELEEISMCVGSELEGHLITMEVMAVFISEAQKGDDISTATACLCDMIRKAMQWANLKDVVRSAIDDRK